MRLVERVRSIFSPHQAPQKRTAPTCAHPSHLPMSISVPPILALIAKAGNLSLLWCLEPYEMLAVRVARGSNLSITLTDDSFEQAPGPRTQLFISVRDDLDLGTFPVLYESSLDIMLKKWNFYSKLFEHLEPIIPVTEDRRARKRDLQDRWLREILYIERILEAAVQWSYSAPCIEPCIPLLYFLAQEKISSDHSLENTEDLTILPDAIPILSIRE